MNELGFVPLLAITAICYLVGATINAFDNEGLNKFIPVIMGTLGGILGIVVFYTIPGYIAADNWIAALATGIVSGFAATGLNQVYKQFKAEEFYEAVSDDEPKEGEPTGLEDS